MHASIACLLLYEDYVWVSLGNAMEGFLDGDLLRQRRGSRDLATEVCTYHHHRVKRGLPVGGKRGLVSWR